MLVLVLTDAQWSVNKARVPSWSLLLCSLVLNTNTPDLVVEVIKVVSCGALSFEFPGR